MGYMTKAEPLDNYFDSMSDLKDYAIRTEDDRALFNTVAKETINRYASQCPEPNKLLFYPVRQSERGYMLITFSHIPKARSTRLVLTFEESNFVESLSSNDLDVILDDLRSIRARGYEIALLLDSGQLRLPTLLYGSFDYFICSFAFAGTAKEIDAKLRSQLHSLVEKLLKYDKPIIAADVEGWPSVELMVQSGLNFISSDSVAPFDVMMNPINPKNMKRIRDMRK